MLSPFWRIVIFHFVPRAAGTLDRRFDAISDALATGCLLACFHQTLSRSASYLIILRSRWFHLVPILALCCAGLAAHPNVYLLGAHSFINISIALYMHRCILFPFRWLNHGPLVQVGVMSYSIYLWQQLFCSEHEGLARIPAYYALPLNILPLLGFRSRFVEGPMQSLGRKLTLKREPLISVPASGSPTEWTALAR